MAEETGKKSWWVTLPGILTQLVALITALTGLVATLYQTGYIGRKAEAPASKATTSVVSNETPLPASPGNAGTGSATTPAMPSSASSAAAMPKGAFPIKIGDTLSDGVPAPGAGMIESPGAEDVYRFSAAPNQRVYFRVLEFSKGMSIIKWRLTDQNDQEVFNTCLGCSDPGVQTLTRGGNYVLTVGNLKDPATGAYRLELTTP